MKLILFLLVIIYASIIDTKYKQVYTITYILLFITGLINLSLLSLLGFILTVLPIFLVALSGGIGGGDVKFSAFCGFCLGGIDGVIGMIIGVSVSLIFMGIKRKIINEQKPYKPFALIPFLSIGYGAVAILGGI